MPKIVRGFQAVLRYVDEGSSAAQRPRLAEVLVLVQAAYSTVLVLVQTAHRSIAFVTAIFANCIADAVARSPRGK